MWVNHLAADGAGNVWAIAAGEVARFDGTGWSRPWSSQANSPRNPSCLYADSRGNLWVGCRDGVTCCDGAKFRRYDSKDGLPESEVRAITEDDQGNLWFGTRDGLCRFDGKDWRTWRAEPGELPRSAVHAVAVDGDRVWFGLDSGAACYDGLAWRTYTLADMGKGAPASGGSVHLPYARPETGGPVKAIAVDPARRVWFGTRSGLRCFDGTLWRTWTTKDFLAGDDITSLAVDLDGSIWVCTPTGMSHVVLEKEE
jgi:ligand-binding sensor domain-containing protein